MSIEGGFELTPGEPGREQRGPEAPAMGGPLPDWLERVVTPIIRDFQVPTPVPVRLGYTPPDCLWIEEVDSPGACGFSMPDGVRASDSDLTWFLADRLQEQFFLETELAWGQPRPPCPGHPHPLAVTMVDGVAGWACPRDGRWVAPVGGLADLRP